VKLDAEGSDASIFEPASSNVRAVLRIRDSKVKEA